MKRTVLRKKKGDAVTFLKTANTITILVIILATATARMGEALLFRRVIFTLHMPIFFLLCGLELITHKEEGKKDGAIFCVEWLFPLFFLTFYGH